MVITMNSYYETLGLIYECYDEGYISEDTKDTLKEKLKEARDKAEEKLSKAKEFAKKHKKALAAAGLGATALSGGAVVANNKLNKDFDRQYDDAQNAFINKMAYVSRNPHVSKTRTDEDFNRYIERLKKYKKSEGYGPLRGLHNYYTKYNTLRDLVKKSKKH